MAPSEEASYKEVHVYTFNTVYTDQHLPFSELVAGTRWLRWSEEELLGGRYIWSVGVVLCWCDLYVMVYMYW